MAIWAKPFVTTLLVAFLTVAGGVWECSRPSRTPVEAEGERLYGRMCSVCHGAQGEGYRADQAPGIGRVAFIDVATDYFLRTAIRNGRAGTTMSAWSTQHGGPLSYVDESALIAYLRSLHAHPPTPLPERSAKGDEKACAEIFARECVKCHGDRGMGGPNVSIGNPELLGTATNAFLFRAIRDGRPGTAMPAFGPTLGDKGVDDVVAHLRRLAAEASPVSPDIPPPAMPIPLGPVPLNPHGPEPVGFNKAPATTKAEVIHGELERGARMALLDARAPSDYRNRHIAGAVSVPFYDPSPYLEQLPKDVWLVAYCACPHAESGTLAQKLQQAGFTKVTILDEGLGFWRTKQYDTHEGIDP